MDPAQDEFVPYGNYQGQRFVATPCFGRLHVPGKPHGHVYEIRENNGQSFSQVGWMPLPDIQAMHGTEQVHVSESSTMCADCLFLMLEEMAEIQRKKSSGAL